MRHLTRGARMWGGLFVGIGSGAVLLSGLLSCGQPVKEEERREVIVSSSTITFVDGDKTASIAIADLDRVSVRTNDRGPMEDDMFWVFAGGSALLEVPSEIPGEDDLWPVFEGLPGFDWGQVIKASTSIENVTFPCWTKSGTSQQP